MIGDLDNVLFQDWYFLGVKNNLSYIYKKMILVLVQGYLNIFDEFFSIFYMEFCQGFL